MTIFLKVAAILFSGIIFLAYGWWNREYLTLIERLLLLSPAYGLLIIGIVPFRFLSLRKIRIISTLIFVVGIAQSIRGIVNAAQSPIEPDTNAAILNIIILVILAIGIYLAWKKTNGDRSTFFQ